MAKLYARLVKDGTWSIEDVPKRWREQVMKLLDK